MSDETVRIHLDDGAVSSVFGVKDANLRAIASATGASVAARGSTVAVSGAAASVSVAAALVNDLAALADEGVRLRPTDVEAASRLVADSPGLSLREVVVEQAVVTGDHKRLFARSRTQQAYLAAIREHDIVLGIGPAGTGKTYLAVALALEALRAKAVRRIILTRPAVEAGERLGFLPGDLVEKVDPYLRPLNDAIHDLADGELTRGLLERGDLEVAPLAFMRGRTLNDAFIILDEAQNTTHDQMKMFLTRMGLRSRMVVTGDVTQIDLPAGRVSGLQEAARILDGIEGIGIVRFTDRDVVRHRLVRDIVKAYERDEEAAGAMPAGDEE